MKVSLYMFTIFAAVAFTISCDNGGSADKANDVENKQKVPGHHQESEKQERNDGHDHSQKPEKDIHAHNEKKSKDSHGHGGGGHEENIVKLSPQQRIQINIKTKRYLSSKSASLTTYKIKTTGEVHLNTYASATVAPRIQVQIVKRWKKKGDHVDKNQSLIEVSSVQMAQAQGALLLADQEWKRIKGLDKDVISAKRLIQGEIKRQLAYAKVQAYGMSITQINELLKKRDGSLATGQFTLYSLLAGTIITDDFEEGQVVEPGKKLMRISDESTLWIEAHVTPLQLKSIKIGQVAKVKRAGLSLTAKVIQLPHVVNEKTRTVAVRLAVDNKSDVLHAGEFVNITLFTKSIGSSITIFVPIEAVVKNGKGQWQVFVESKPNTFEAQDVKIIKNLDKQVQIQGVNTSNPIVIKGAFFLQSELAKSGFETHNH